LGLDGVENLHQLELKVKTKLLRFLSKKKFHFSFFPFSLLHSSRYKSFPLYVSFCTYLGIYKWPIVFPYARS
jgi:hypothetical protein